MTNLGIVIPFIWFGMIAGISCIEAPLKFTAPDVTLSIGLSIGSVVFYVLNKVELVLLAIWLITLFLQRSSISKLLVSIIVLMLLIQTAWLLPALEERAHLIRAGLPAPGRSPHIYYVVCEGIKLLLLPIAGWSCLKKLK